MNSIVLLSLLASLLTTVEMYRDYSSPFNDPCGASATQAHYGDIAYTTVSNSGREKRGATAIRERLWPNARVPYEISPRYNTEEKNRIYEAMRQWESQTCIRFYERPEDHTASYLYFFKGGCCASYVGRQTENLQQGVSLGNSCTRFSTYLHEIGHAIGFWHEQSRPDRDEYINVLMDNMMTGSQSNFRIEEQINSLGVGYDYNSIMHYSSTAFGAGRTTLIANDPSIPVGGAVELSELDILQANLLYSCDADNLPPSELPPPVAATESTPPPLPPCHEEFVNEYYGELYSNSYPAYDHNQNCAYRIQVPEGTSLNITVVDLNLEWSRGCTKDSLTVYRTMDGSGYPQWASRCGTGSNMTIRMDGNMAYVKFVSDAVNDYNGYRGFSAIFEAEDIDECQEDNGGCSQTCQNEAPGYKCLCDDGWFLSGDMKTCFDMNECAIGNGGCQHKCTNTGGSFSCECPEGSTLNADGRTCSNPGTSCDVDNGGCDHVCSEGSNGVSCLCREGFRLLPDGQTCRDIDECVEGNTCSYGGCRNTEGSYECVCQSGYEMDTNSENCINVDECARGLDLCQGEAVCQDMDGSYECTCRDGLTVSADGYSCIDVNECEEDGSICSHGCQNTHGSYECLCPPGYQHTALTTDSCLDINECLEGGCSDIEGATCINTEGSYECQCGAGYRLSSNGQTCEDIDECTERPNYCRSGCSNTDGSFVCTCPESYMLKPDGRTCKCGGVFTETSGKFSTPFWPVQYPQENFECEWIVKLTNPNATIQFTIDDSAYGINGRSPCSKDNVRFYDGIDENSRMTHKFCQFDRPEHPIETTTSQGKVMFTGYTNPRRPKSRVGVQVLYTTIEPPSPTTPTPTKPATSPTTQATTATTEEPTTAAPTTQATTATTEEPTTTAPTTQATTATTEEPTTAAPTTQATTPTTEEPTTEPTPAPVNECLTNNGGCEQVCVDTATSSHCECRPGYSLKTNGRNCRVDCGGELTGTRGSFQTPDWPDSYPQANFKCVWTITRPSSAREIRFTIDEEHYGINGRNPCTDYLQFFRGSSQNNPQGEKYCFIHAPTDPIVITSKKATVVFKGSKNNRRRRSRVGAKIYYEIV